MTEPGAREPTKWHSCEEIEFIKTLKPETVIKYSEALKLRFFWGQIEPHKIYAFLGREWKGDATNVGTGSNSVLC